jgi:hypothetical protein
MNRFRVWGLAAALAVGAGAPAIAADPPVNTSGLTTDTSGLTTDNRPWYKRMFFSSSAPKPVGPTLRSGPVTGMVRAPSVTLTPEAVAETMKAEYLAWERRMSVCLKLREAANARGDEALMRQVDELERQANAIYQQRVTALGVPKIKAPLPPSSNTGFAASFDLAPEKPIDPKAAAAKLVAPAAPVPVETASVREVNP